MNDITIKTLVKWFLNIITGALRTPLFVSCAVLIMIIPLLIYGENTSYGFLQWLPGLKNADVITEVSLLKSLGITCTVLSYGVLMFEKILKKSISIPYKLLVGIYSVGYSAILIIFYTKDLIPFGIAAIVFGGFWVVTLICIGLLKVVQQIEYAIDIELYTTGDDGHIIT